MAALFPMMMNLHLVALVVMLISLSGSDRAQGGDGCDDGEYDFLHYETLKSVLWSKPMQHDACRIGVKACHITWVKVGTVRNFVYLRNTRCVVSPVLTRFALNWPSQAASCV
jgi:hypothetical protein